METEWMPNIICHSNGTVTKNLKSQKEDLDLVDISKRSLTELTLQPVAPALSSSCSQSAEHSNQFMFGSRRRLLRNCFISIDSGGRHWMLGLVTGSGLYAEPPVSCELIWFAKVTDWCDEHELTTNKPLQGWKRARRWSASDYFSLFICLTLPLSPAIAHISFNDSLQYQIRA